jgi:uncharacterized delta-60 repeat protein
MKKQLVLATFFFTLLCVRAQVSGSLDLSFGGTGFFTTAITEYENGGRAVVIQQDGKIVVGGFAGNGTNTDFAVVRYNPDGSLDDSFGSDGMVTTDISGNDYAFTITLLSAGRILAGGYATPGANQDFALACYNSDGTLYSSFGTGGIVTNPMGNANDQIWSLAVQSDGKIMAGGVASSGFNLNLALARYTATGALDNTYASGGKIISSFGYATNQVCTILIQSGNKTVVTGYGFTPPPSGVHCAMARYTEAGVLDASFGNNGIATAQYNSPYTFSYGLAATLGPDESIYQVGTGGQGGNWLNFGIMKFTPSGVLDNTFGVGGKVITAFADAVGAEAESVAVQEDDKIVVAGELNTGTESGQDFALVRYNTNGSLDDTFGDNGIVTTPVGDFADYGFSTAIQDNGAIVLAGFSNNGTHNDLAIARYRGDTPGTNVAETDLAGNVQTYPNPSSEKLNVVFDSDRGGICSMRIADLSGRIVLSRSIVAVPGVNRAMMDLRSVPSGWYLLIIGNDEHTQQVRIVKE